MTLNSGSVSPRRFFGCATQCAGSSLMRDQTCVPALGAWRFNRCTAGEALLNLLTPIGRSGKWRGCRVLDLNHSTDSRFLRLPWGGAWGTVAVACGRPPPLEEESVVLLPGSKSCGKRRRLGGGIWGSFLPKALVVGQLWTWPHVPCRAWLHPACLRCRQSWGGPALTKSV